MSRRVRSGWMWRSGRLVGVFALVVSALSVTMAVRGRGPAMILVAAALLAILYLLWRLVAFVDIEDGGLRVPRLGRQRWRWDEIAAFECAEALTQRPPLRPEALVKMHLTDGTVIRLPAPRGLSMEDQDFREALSLLRARLPTDPGQPAQRWPALPFPPHAH